LIMQCNIWWQRYHVNQVIVVSNDFTEDFIGECEYEYDIGISLLTSSDLLKIYGGFHVRLHTYARWC